MPMIPGKNKHKSAPKKSPNPDHVVCQKSNDIQSENVKKISKNH